MNELIFIGNVQTMSSREIAELTGKEHRNVLADCDKLNVSYVNLGLAEISAGVYLHPNTGSQQHRQYLLTKMQCMDLMTGYNTELRIKVNRRWEELEMKEQSKLPQTYLEALKALVVSEEEKQKALTTIAEQKDKVSFAEAVLASKTSCLIGELAKLLTQNGFEIGQNRLFELLRKEGYLGKVGERRNIPNQQYIEQGLFELKKRCTDWE